MECHSLLLEYGLSINHWNRNRVGYCTEHHCWSPVTAPESNFQLTDWGWDAVSAAPSVKIMKRAHPFRQWCLYKSRNIREGETMTLYMFVAYTNRKAEKKYICYFLLSSKTSSWKFFVVTNKTSGVFDANTRCLFSADCSIWFVNSNTTLFACGLAAWELGQSPLHASQRFSSHVVHRSTVNVKNTLRNAMIKGMSHMHACMVNEFHRTAKRKRSINDFF